MKRLTALLALAACAPAAIDGARFDQLTQGRSFAVQEVGEPPYGSITFLTGQRVLWDRDATGLCHAGTWQERTPGEICFSYNNPTREICWYYEADLAGNMTMQVVGDDRLYSYTPLPTPQPCTPNA